MQVYNTVLHLKIDCACPSRCFLHREGIVRPAYEVKQFEKELENWLFQTPMAVPITLYNYKLYLVCTIGTSKKI